MLQPREGAGKPQDAYRLALLAEKLAQALIHQQHATQRAA